jgi:dipeptidyl aminopeptidase/acylaminoacyl peptidase
MIQKCIISYNPAFDKLRVIVRAALVSFLGFLILHTVAAAPAFTIEQVLSAPFPYALTASPNRDAVAWVQNAAGVRNVWIGKAPDYRATQVTTFAEDDGQEIGEIAWSPDTTRLFFTRGEGPNGRGEIPNPTSDPAGLRQEIWSVALGNNPVKAADGHSAAVSPDGSTLAWIVNGQIWSMLLNHLDSKAGQLIHARGTASDLRWSPDGQRLAFVSGRGDHAFIGVYDARAKSLRFLDPSVDSDQSPTWSADGKQIAFIRRAASSEFEYGARPAGQPWSIHVANVETGACREVWRAYEGRGSVFRGLAGEEQLFWRAGAIVFPWERDGWLHLWSVATGVEKPVPVVLTPGNFEVEDVASGADGSLVYSSNQDDADRRHLWKIEVIGKPPQLLTPGQGIEWSPVLLQDGRVVFLHSDARRPARAALLERDGSLRDLAPGPLPDDFPAAALTQPQAVTITAADGMRVHGQLFLPPAGGTAKHPAVVFFHGGSRRQMLLGWHYMEYYDQAYGFNQYLASRGYVVLSVNYRSGIGYGLEFRETPHYGATGASEFNDVLGAAAFLRGRSDVDAARIGVWGGSYGGYLAALALARASDKFAAGVDLHGVHDWNLEATSTAPARDREKRQAIEKLAFESSPMASIATWRSPVLLIQGDDDRTVVFAQTVQLTEALRKQGVHVEQLIFPDEIHEFLLHADWLKAYHAADEFLARYLKP